MSEIAKLYESGMSLPQIEERLGIPSSTVRSRLKKEGVELRSRAESIRLAASQGRIGSGLRGKKRHFTEEWRKNLSKSRLGKGKGTSLKATGYICITAGPHLHRPQHVVIFEERLGRKIKSDECVHHIDGVKTNNDMNNLALMTFSAHARLHYRERVLSGKFRDRNKKGEFK